MKISNANLSTERKILKEAEKIINQANNKQELSLKKQNKIKKIILPIISTVFILALISISFIFAVITSHSQKIVSGVSINNVDISNLSRDDALQKLNLQLARNTANELTITHNDYSTTLKLSDIQSSFDFESAINDAYSIGKKMFL